MRILAMRVIGALNFLFIALGIYYAVGMLSVRWNKWPGAQPDFAWAIYLVFWGLSLSFLAYLAYAGVKLFKKDDSVLRPLGIVFLLELLFLVASVQVDWVMLSPSVANHAVGFWEAGRDLLTPQYLTGYPLIGAIATFGLSFKRKRRIAGAPS